MQAFGDKHLRQRWPHAERGAPRQWEQVQTARNIPGLQDTMKSYFGSSVSTSAQRQHC